MKYKINIEIERTTTIGNYSPNTSESEENENAIEVKAKEIPNEKGFKIIKNDEQILVTRMQN
jgi:hypothetical protein